MTDISRRLERLERRLARRPSAGELVVISIVGGFQDDDADRPESVGAPGSEFFVQRGPDESRQEFAQRVRVEGRRAGVTGTIVIGGFSDE